MRYSTKYFDVETGLYYYGYRYYLTELGRWLTRDPLGEAGGPNLYGFVYNDPMNWVDPYGDSPFSVMAKFMVKKGLIKGLKEFAEKKIKQRLKQYMTNKTKKEFAQDLVDILGTLDSAWWEICIEFFPVIGDVYGTGKFALKARKAYDKMQDLENKYVKKIYDSLPKSKRKDFMNEMRQRGVYGAKVDTKAYDDVTGSVTDIKGKHGHHTDSVSSHPERASDPRGIDWKSPTDHLKEHGGNWQNPTSSGGKNNYRN